MDSGSGLTVRGGPVSARGWSPEQLFWAFGLEVDKDKMGKKEGGRNGRPHHHEPGTIEAKIEMTEM